MLASSKRMASFGTPALPVRQSPPRRSPSLSRSRRRRRESAGGGLRRICASTLSAGRCHGLSPPSIGFQKARQDRTWSAADGRPWSRAKVSAARRPSSNSIREERPLGVQLGGVAELHHHVAVDAVDPHGRPSARPRREPGSATLRKSAIIRSSLSSTALNDTSLTPAGDGAGGLRQLRALHRVDLHEEGVVATSTRGSAASASGCRCNRRPSTPRRRSRPPGTWSAGRPRRAARPG